MTEGHLRHSDIILKHKSLSFVRNTLNQFPLPPLFLRSHCHALTEQLHKGEEKAHFFPQSFSSPAPTGNTSPSSSPTSVLPSGRASSQGMSASLGSSHSSESSVSLDRPWRIMPDHSSLSSILMKCHLMTSYFGLSKTLHVPYKTFQEN